MQNYKSTDIHIKNNLITKQINNISKDLRFYKLKIFN